MVRAWLERLTSGPPVRLPQDEARLALAALLVRLARADGVYAPEEKQRIDAVLTARHKVGLAEAAALRAEAEAVEAEAPDTVRFTRALKDAVALEERVQLIEAMWTVVLVDGDRDAAEDRLMRMVAPLLGISDRDSGLARQRVEKRAL